MKQAASDRYVLNAKRQASCYKQLEYMVSQGDTKYKHHDLGPKRIVKNECNVVEVTNVLEETFSNPFDGDE